MMTPLESWALIVWLFFPADGEANVFTPPQTPVVTRHYTKLECEKRKDYVLSKLNNPATLERSSGASYANGMCVKIMEGERRLEDGEL